MNSLLKLTIEFCIWLLTLCYGLVCYIRNPINRSHLIAPELIDFECDIDSALLCLLFCLYMFGVAWMYL